MSCHYVPHLLYHAMYFLSRYNTVLITQSSIVNYIIYMLSSQNFTYDSIMMTCAYMQHIFCVCIKYIIFQTLLYTLSSFYCSCASLYIVIYFLTHINKQCIQHAFNICGASRQNSTNVGNYKIELGT